ncbi:MAG: hypothetical protein ABI720_11395, partial [Actinomycetes bacterium]
RASADRERAMSGSLATRSMFPSKGGPPTHPDGSYLYGGSRFGWVFPYSEARWLPITGGFA